MSSDIRILLLYRKIKKLFPEAQILSKEEVFGLKVRERSAFLNRSNKKKPKAQNIEAQPATEPPRIARRCSRVEMELTHVDQLQICFKVKGGRK